MATVCVCGGVVGSRIEICKIFESIAFWSGVLCYLVFLHVGDIFLLVFAHVQLHLLEVSISRVFGSFNLANSVFCRGGNDKLLVCSMQ